MTFGLEARIYVEQSQVSEFKNYVLATFAYLESFT